MLPVGQRVYPVASSKFRYLIENAFLKLKQWRGITTRYAQITSSFLAAAQIRSLFFRVNTV